MKSTHVAVTSMLTPSDLQRRSVEDAAAVKMLTIIGLLFLPLTVVTVCTSFLSGDFATRWR